MHGVQKTETQRSSRHQRTVSPVLVRPVLYPDINLGSVPVG